MHALLAHVYHLALYAIHVATRPVWRPLGACLAVALAGRLSGHARRPRGAALVAGAAVLAGWCVEAPPLAWPLPPVARLTGLAAIITIGALLRAGGRRIWFLPLTALLAAWWLLGARVDRPAILHCLPVFMGFWAALAFGNRLARGDRGWSMLASAGALAGGLMVTGASPHWARAAGVPAMAALGLLGTEEAMPALAGLIVAVSLAALVASDRGRLAPVDVACVAPLLTWALVPFLARRAGRWAWPGACIQAAGAGLALAWAAVRVLR